MTSAVEQFEFDQDTRTEPAPGGGWQREISDRWDGTTDVPNGGHVATVAVRALARELPHPHPISVSALFVRPARPGPAHVQTEVVRTGRRVSFGTASLTQAGTPVVRVQAAFGDLERDDAPGLAYERLAPPDLPPPEACVDPMSLHPSADRHLPRSVLGRIEVRVADLPGWTRGEPGGRPSLTAWVRLRDGRPADPTTMVQFADGLPPAIADLASWSTTVELTVHARAVPAPGWLRARVDTRHVGRGLHEEETELWDENDVLVAQSRQLALVLPWPERRR